MNCVRKKIMEARSKVKHSPDSKDTKPLKSILSRRIFKILFFFRFVQKDIILQPLARVCPLGIRFIKIYFTIWDWKIFLKRNRVPPEKALKVLLVLRLFSLSSSIFN